MVERAERSYRLEPLDGSGVFLGLGVIQCALLGVGITAAVVVLTAGWGLPLAIVPVAAATAFSFARTGGHPLWEWLPLGVFWVWSRVRRGARWQARLPLYPDTAGRGLALPPCLAGLEIVEVAWHGGGQIGAVRDRERATLTGLVTVTGPQFVVEPRAEQERLLAGWGDVLSQFAVERGAVTHLAWSDLARPSGMREHLAWLATLDHPDRNAGGSYAELVAAGTAHATGHEITMTVTVARDRLGRRARQVGGGSAELMARTLASSLDALTRGLRSAGLSASDPLGADAVRRLLRTRIDPFDTGPRPRRGRLAQRLGLVPAAAGPLLVEGQWRHARVDGAWHRTFWIGCWPRLAVPPSWMEPFLSGGGVTRTVTVVLVPVPAHQSRRRIERDLVKLESDAATKEDKGRRVDARHRRATQALLNREEELVAGYAEVAYCGLVTVTARSADELDEHSEIIEQLARESGLELRLLDGRQDVAWAAGLPFGLAPKTLLAA